MEKCRCKSTVKTSKEKQRGKQCTCKSADKTSSFQYLVYKDLKSTMQSSEQIKDVQYIKQGNGENLHMVVFIDELPNSTYILSLEKNGIQYRSGQYVAIGIPGDIQSRHYSIYSGESNDTLDFLIKEVDNGMVSSALHNLKKGDKVIVEGPWGHFRIKPSDLNKKFLFIATGTGISPFHSFIKTYPQLDYKLVHGVRTGEDCYEKHEYSNSKYISCTSRDKKGDFHGRVTEYITANPADPNTLCYLCGNNLMIEEMHTILRSQGVTNENILTEIFF